MAPIFTKMPQDMPLEGNKAGEGFNWKFAIKVAEEVLSQSDSENSQPMCSQVYTSSKFAKHMSGRFVCYLIIYKLFSLDFPFFGQRFPFPFIISKLSIKIFRKSCKTDVHYLC